MAKPGSGENAGPGPTLAKWFHWRHKRVAKHGASQLGEPVAGELRRGSQQRLDLRVRDGRVVLEERAAERSARRQREAAAARRLLHALASVLVPEQVPLNAARKPSRKQA